ncbi:unnamed protein product, partial [Didymodactylos carnosus]
RGSGQTWENLSCDELGSAAENDGLLNVANGFGHYVALLIWPDNDFHWVRKDSNGYWSHKPGYELIELHILPIDINLDTISSFALASYTLTVTKPYLNQSDNINIKIIKDVEDNNLYSRIEVEIIIYRWFGKFFESASSGNDSGSCLDHVLTNEDCPLRRLCLEETGFGKAALVMADV